MATLLAFSSRPRPWRFLPCFVALGIDRLSPAAIFPPLIESPVSSEVAAEEAAVRGSPERRQRASAAIAAAARMRR